VAQPAKATPFAGGRRRDAIGGRSGQKPRLLPAVDEVMSAKIAAGDFGQ
jgi:hypothetical protein